MKFLRGRRECRGLGSPHAASFKLWGRADGSSQGFLLADFCFLKQNVGCGYPGLLALNPGVPWLSSQVGSPWVGKGFVVADFQSLGVLRGLSRKGLTGRMSGPVNVHAVTWFFFLQGDKFYLYNYLFLNSVS